MQFKLKITAKPVAIENEEGKEVQYELREMSAQARDRYLDRLQGRMRIDKDGRPAGLSKYEGLQADLVSSCLYVQETGASVPQIEVQKWPSSVVAELFKEAQILNHLNEEKSEKKDEPEKNG